MTSQSLSGVFEVRLYPRDYSISNMLRNSIPDPVANSSGKLFVVTGSKRAIDVRRVEHLISQVDFRQVRARRQEFAKLVHEARLSEEPGRGISFTAMLMMLAHHKLIDDEKALMWGTTTAFNVTSADLLGWTICSFDAKRRNESPISSISIESEVYFAQSTGDDGSWLQGRNVAEH